MKTRQIEEIATTLKSWIGHFLKRHLTEILNQSTTLKVSCPIYFYDFRRCITLCTLAVRSRNVETVFVRLIEILKSVVSIPKLYHMPVNRFIHCPWQGYIRVEKDIFQLVWSFWKFCTLEGLYFSTDIFYLEETNLGGRFTFQSLAPI